jgi:hypothetical protein
MNESPQEPRSDLDRLFARAREQRPDTSRAQYGFETRLMSRLRERRQPDPGSLWALVTWRMVPFFAAGVLALVLWNSEVIAETNDAAGMSVLQNPEAVDLLNGWN